MADRRFHPYAHALRRRREEALNELKLTRTIAEEKEEQKVEPQDDCDHDLFCMLVVLILLRILNVILMEVALTALNKN